MLPLQTLSRQRFSEDSCATLAGTCVCGRCHRLYWLSLCRPSQEPLLLHIVAKVDYRRTLLCLRSDFCSYDFQLAICLGVLSSQVGSVRLSSCLRATDCRFLFRHRALRNSRPRAAASLRRRACHLKLSLRCGRTLRSQFHAFNVSARLSVFRRAVTAHRLSIYEAYAPVAAKALVGGVQRRLTPSSGASHERDRTASRTRSPARARLADRACWPSNYTTPLLYGEEAVIVAATNPVGALTLYTWKVDLRTGQLTLADTISSGYNASRHAIVDSVLPVVVRPDRDASHSRVRRCGSGGPLGRAFGIIRSGRGGPDRDVLGPIQGRLYRRVRGQRRGAHPRTLDVRWQAAEANCVLGQAGREGETHHAGTLRARHHGISRLERRSQAADVESLETG